TGRGRGGGVTVQGTAEPFDERILDTVCTQAEGLRGGVLSSGMEYPGRYSRWHLAYVNPCAELVARGRRISARALNARGEVLLPVLGAALLRVGEPGPGPDGRAGGAGGEVEVVIPEPAGVQAEEDRSRRPTVFSALREVVAAMAARARHLALSGAFGSDLAFQFEPVGLRHRRPGEQRDLVLHLPDELYVLDRKRETATRYRYDFEVAGASTRGLPRRTPPAPTGGPPQPLPPRPEPRSFAPGVAGARGRLAPRDPFEGVPPPALPPPSASPASFYQRLRRRNPAPYEFFLNLGEGECLVGASPEMYVRVTGDRVETCPISGTIRRGTDPLEDAANIRALLNSAKEESE